MGRRQGVRSQVEASAVCLFGYLGLVNALETGWRSLHPAGRRLNAHNRERSARIRDLYGQFVKRGDLCFDVGANRGNRIDTFIDLGTRVIAVEPHPDCVTYLRNKYRRWHNVVIVPNGLAGQPGQMTMMLNWRSDLSTLSPNWIEDVSSRGSTYRKERWDRIIEITVTTLDDLIAEHGMPSFCKIDVEGFEDQVVAGLTQPIPMISMEYTLEHIGPGVAGVERLGRLADYEFNYSPGEDMVFALGSWVDAGKMVEILNQRADEAAAKQVHGSGDVYARLRGAVR